MSLFDSSLNEIDSGLSTLGTGLSTLDTGLSKVDSLAASQKVRLFDIYALGPILLYASTRKAPLGRWTKRTLFVAGIMTIVYNWKRYRTIETDLKKAAQNVGL